MTRGHSRRRWAGVWGAAAALAVAAPATAAEFDRTFSYSADELTVGNLIGAVKVERAPGNEFKVSVRVRGKDANASLIQFEEHPGKRAELVLNFPVDEYRDYVYPELGSGSRVRFNMNEGNHDFLSEILNLSRADRIEVRGRPWGDALELWADVTVQVPANRRIEAYLGCGEIDATGVDGDLALRTKTGAIVANDIDGELGADTGSGSVTVRGVRGDVNVDTGSGGVQVAEIRAEGDVRLDTGSGSVRATDVTAKVLFIDTGSGHIELANVKVRDLDLDTGSGGVEGDDVDTEDAMIDTGSGSVDLELVRVGRGRYVVDTGSGGIRVALPRELSASFDCSTGSGSIHADIEGVSLSRDERQDAQFDVGGGAAAVKLSTGSGSIRLAQNAATAQR